MLGHSILYLGLAAFSGVMMALQGTINSALGDKVGPGETNFIVHVTAAIILIIILLFTAGKINFTLMKNVPWYLYLGGLIGVLITYSVILSIPKLGVAVATTAIITGQVLTAALIDHFGFLGLEEVPFTWVKFGGIIFLALGVRLLLN